MLFLGIDLGTSSVKALLVDEEGVERSFGAADYDISVPSAGHAEQDVWILWQATAAAIRQALAGVSSASDIAAIGLSGQMHGLVALDVANAPLRPMIIWADQRSGDQASRLDSAENRAITLNRAATGFMASSLLWMRENEPAIFARIAHVLPPKDYIRLRLTGEIGTDWTDASAAMLLDTAARDWSDRLLGAIEVDRSVLPQIHASREVAGRITAECAAETGLPAGTLVVYGGGDQPMQLVGNGIVEPGVVASNIGTACQISSAVSSPVFDPAYRTNTLCHAPDHRWVLMGAGLNGGIALKWLRGILGSSCSYRQIDALAAAVPAGADGLVFLPYLAGERSPHMNPDARGVFFGLMLGHSTGHLARAVMEGVTYSMRECLEILLDLGIACDRIVASGGGAKSPFWLQMQADIFGRPIVITASEHQAALGAAICAAVGANVYTSFADACRRMVRFRPVVTEPGGRRHIHDAEFPRFKELYTRNRDLFTARRG